MQRKKIILVFIVALLFNIFLPGSVYAEEEAIHDVKITAELSENGNAQITEVWDVTVAEGTEWYLTFLNMEDMPITNLTVADETGVPYTYQENWDIDRDLAQKANTCGIVKKGASDYELCWGVGSYGRHQFTITYTIEQLVKVYSDYAGFHHTFLTKGLSADVDQARVEITYPGQSLDSETAAIWAFGFSGAVNFSGSNIVALNEERITNNQGIIITVQLDPELFPAASIGSGTFEEIKEEAFKNSDYDQDEKSIAPVILAIFGGVILFIGIIIAFAAAKSGLPDVYYKRQYGKTRAELKKTALEKQEIPFSGDWFSMTGILLLFNELPLNTSLINQYMLKWLREEAITEKTEQRKNKTITTIHFNYPSYGDENLERELYTMLVSASDKGDLSEKKITKWVEKKYKDIGGWYEKYKKQAKDTLKQRGLLVTTEEKKLLAKGTVEVLNDEGWQYANDLYGFRKYLLSISKGEAKTQIREELWDDYLVYADLFHINAQMEKQYDEYYSGHFPYYGYYFISRSFRQSYQTGEASVGGGSGGGGGGASLGGGGGASGGGGGGSR